MSQPFRRACGALVLAALALPGAAAAQAAAPACKYVEFASVPLRYTGPHLEITMTGSINGTPALMLVDTGAWDTVLTRTGTERRNLMLRHTGKHAYGIGGIARIYRTRVNEFSAGGAKAGKGDMPVLADFGFVPSYDAIVGAPFLLQADLEISLATKQLKFFQPFGCEQRFLAYWDPEAIVIDFDASTSNQQNPQFFVSVNGRKLTAMIDSGAASTSITLRAARRAGLKLDDPGVTRVGDSVGAGERKVPRWRTVFDTFQIGDETVRNADISVLDRDSDSDVDVLLGADFLRAHRVLFAMSQHKIYLSYVGGEPFGQRRKLEPWIVTEAEAGNSDAQFALARMYTEGRLVAKDAALGASWLEKAARGGNPYANLGSGRQLMLTGFPEEGAARLRSALDQLPTERNGALWLYIARVRSKQPALAASELAASLARSDDQWPRPIADFYLGKLTAEALLAAAGSDAALATARSCEALLKMAEWYQAHGDRARVSALEPQGRAHCEQPAATPEAAPASPTEG